MNADGSGKVRLTTNPANEKAPQWSSDGSKIVFQRWLRNGDICEIWRMDPDGANQTRVAEGPYADQDPAVSPDGRQIAFASVRTGAQDIFVMNRGGSGVRQLAAAPNNDFQPDRQRLGPQRLGL